MHAISRTALASAVLLAIAGAAFAEDAPDKITPPGLPSGVDWTFNFDAAFGAFGFGNSLYTNPKPDEPSGNLGDNWFEGSIKPALSGEYTTSSSSQIYGKVSAVGERTYGASPSLVGGDAGSFGVEDAYIGWRSGKSLENLGENALDFTVGRTQYKLGHGMLLWDGAAEGGSRGGYWSNVRKAFEFAAIGRLHTGNNRLEVFYLDKDELPESDSKTKITGVNYEYAIGEGTTLGGTYMHLTADPSMRPERDGLNVYNLRAFTTPFPNLKALTIDAEYAKEDNGDALDSDAWNVQVAWQFESSWKPKLSYRYAFFEGDDPTTSKNEAFDGLLTGFYDWGTWWQGEIGGEYFVSNSNLITNEVRLHTTPTESIGTGLMFFDFKLDNPASAGVTSSSVAKELDWYMDWTVNPHLIVSFVAAVADPGKAVEQSSGRTDTFIYGMIYAAYSF
jgi:hypothetical protein